MNVKDLADAWERGWNSHDLDVIMKHYRDDIIFRSRKAIPLIGNGEIRGAQTLRTYWAAALARQPDLEFRVKDVFEGHQVLVILYLNHLNVLATEILYFDDNGYIFQAAACHAVVN